MRTTASLCGCILVAACSSGGGSEEPVRVTSGIYVTPEVGVYQSVAPDGSLLIAAGRDICVEPTDSDSRTICASLPGDNTVGEAAGGWAGDGSQFVFHDRRTTARTFESTVLSLDTETGEVTELIAGEGLTALDLAVSAGGEVALTGFVGDATGGGRSGTFGLGNDGSFTLLSDVAGEAIEWLPDSKGLAVSARSRDHEGLFVLPANGGSARLVVAADGTLGPPSLAGVSKDGEWALVYWRVLVARDFFPAGVPFYSVVSLDDGDVTALIPGPGGTDFVGPVAAALSPDGERVAYAYFGAGDRDGPLVLATRQLPDGPEEIVDSDLFETLGPPPTPDTLLSDGEANAVWTDDQLVLRTRTWAIVLLLG